MIDDTCDTSIGNSLNDIRNFVNAQPATTVVGVGYMSNTTIQIVQNFTADHAAAAKAIRLPRGNLSAMDSPYLSLISLIKGWPEQKVRREVLMVTDGIDRLRGEGMSNTQYFPTYGRGYRNSPGTMSPGMPSMIADADSASTAAQRYGVIVHGIYATGVGRSGRNRREVQLGQGGVAQISEESGGEYFSLGGQNFSVSSLTLTVCNRFSIISITWFSKLPRKRSLGSSASVFQLHWKILRSPRPITSGFPFQATPMMTKSNLPRSAPLSEILAL